MCENREGTQIGWTPEMQGGKHLMQRGSYAGIAFAEKPRWGSYFASMMRFAIA